MKHLNELENAAFKMRNSGDYEGAIKLFEKIIAENPNYEFGACFYHIADCLEELGEYGKAKELYLIAIEYDDSDVTRLGNFASFLYLHGDTNEALTWHLRLLSLEKKYGLNTKNALIVINNLAKKIGMTEVQVLEMTNKTE